MKITEERAFRIPVSELRSLLESQYGVSLEGVEPYLDKDSIVFAVRYGESKWESPSSGLTKVMSGENPKGIRRQRKKRNRIKTRGWKIVGKIKSANGLTANVYEPFVNALEGREITRTDQEKIVRGIMVKNDNNPSDDSIEYFLNNTLQYLSERKSEVGNIL